MTNILSVTTSFFALLLCLTWPVLAQNDTNPAFTISVFPQEAYLGEPVTFAFKGKKGIAVKATLEGTELCSTTFSQKTLELNLSLAKSGLLQFSDGTTSYEFRLILPTDKAVITIHDGIFYNKNKPAILLTYHRSPPKHNRRWEVFRILNALVRDTRPLVKSATVVGPRSLAAQDLQTFEQFSKTTNFWKCIQPKHKYIYELDQIIAGDLHPSDDHTLLIALSGNDLKRGMSLLRFRMRLEWILQRERSYTQVFVLSLPFDQRVHQMFPEASKEVKLAARSNGAEYVDVAGKDLESRIPDVIRRMRAQVRF